MKTVLPLLLAFTIPVFAGAFAEEFEEISKSGDREAIAEFLERSAVQDAGDPDFYALAGNYWWQLSSSPVISRKPADGEDLSVRDQKTGEEVGSISISGKTNPEFRAKAIALISEGVTKFPKRGDLVLGLASIRKEMGNDAVDVAVLLGLLETSKAGSLKWTANGELPSKAETFLPEAIQILLRDAEDSMIEDAKKSLKALPGQ